MRDVYRSSAPAPKAVPKTVPVPAPVKPKPRPLSRPKHDRALAYQIEALRSDGWLRADILDVLGITLAQYEARRLWSRRKNRELSGPALCDDGRSPAGF